MSIGSVLNIGVRRLIKSFLKFEASVDKIISKFDDGCPSKEELLSIVEQKNQINNSIDQVQSSISTLDNTLDTINTVISVLKVNIRIIKLLPIPSAVAGVGVPIGLITTFSDLLDVLHATLKEGSSTSNQTVIALRMVNNLLNSLKYKLNNLDQLLINCLSELDDVDNLVEDLQNSINSRGDFEDDEDNKFIEEELKKRLNNGEYIYKNYRLKIEYNKDNLFEFPQRRVVGVNINNFKDIVIRQFFKGDNSWSYSSSLKILVEEIKFVIDNHLKNKPILNSPQEISDKSKPLKLEEIITLDKKI